MLFFSFSDVLGKPCAQVGVNRPKACFDLSSPYNLFSLPTIRHPFPLFVGVVMSTYIIIIKIKIHSSWEIDFLSKLILASCV